MAGYGAFYAACIVHLQLAVRDVELGTLFPPQEHSVFDFTLGEPEIQERLSSQSAARGIDAQ